MREKSNKISIAGMIIFLSAFFLFNLTLFIGKYEITNTSLESSGLNEEQLDLLVNELGPLPVQNLTKSELISFVSPALRRVNDELKQLGKTNLFIYNKPDIVFNIAKGGLKGFYANNIGCFTFLVFFLGILGALLIYLPKLKHEKPGIKNTGIFFNPLTSRKLIGYSLSAYLILFYIFLYFLPVYITEAVAITDPVSKLILGTPAGKWFMYGLLYTLFILVMGIRFIIRYRHNRYQVLRTISVIFFQIVIAFSIPQILIVLQKPYMDFKNIWPLDYSFFFSYRIKEYLSAGTLGYFMLFWGIALIIIAVPLFTWLYGKRWYCSWVCGCGGLAETAGDPFRQLSDKSLKAWKFERRSIYSILIFSFIMTLLTIVSLFLPENNILGVPLNVLHGIYGFLVGSILAGVIGTGIYPIMGNRVWCRFFCPLAGYLGIIQRFKSRFRITTNGGQCISCGNCSTYCEMGIDVRSYAQKGQNIVRASCVGCGICAAVCPRGVLKLENSLVKGRIKENPILTGNLNNL
jgi:polyferredoxin